MKICGQDSGLVIQNREVVEQVMGQNVGHGMVQGMGYDVVPIMWPVMGRDGWSKYWNVTTVLLRGQDVSLISIIHCIPSPLTPPPPAFQIYRQLLSKYLPLSKFISKIEYYS